MKREYKRAELSGRTPLAQSLKSLLTTEGLGQPGGSPQTPPFFDFCQRVWDANWILRKYVSADEIGGIVVFGSGLTSQGRSAQDAAGETIDLLSQAACILADQVKRPKLVGFLCPVRSVTSLPSIDAETGFRLGPFSLVRGSNGYVSELQETFRESMTVREDEFGHDITDYDMQLSREELKEAGLYGFPEALSKCFLGRICFRAEAPRSPYTLWPMPMGLGGMFDVDLYDQQLLERFQNLMRYIFPSFDLALDGPRVELDYQAKTALVKSSGEPGTTSILDAPLPRDFRTKLLSLHNALNLACKVEFARSLEAAIFWAGSAKSDDPELMGISRPPAGRNAVDYLKFMIALESLLILASDDITRAVSSRVACVLEREYAQIEHFKKRMKRLYDIRSRVVHEGEWFVSPPDMAELEKVTRRLIDTLLENPERWESKQELAKWAEVKEWVTLGSSDVYVPPERVRQWVAAIEEARS